MSHKLTIYGEAGSAAIKYAKRNKIPYVPDVSAVKLNKSKATLVVGAKLTLKAALRPTGSKSALTWSTSNKKVATVTGKGVVKAVGKGTAIITVRTDNGKKTTCKVTVPAAPKTVKFAKDSYTVKVGKTVRLVPRLIPTGAKTAFTFASSNKKIATVDGKGRVKGVRAGTATITVRTAKGLKATVKVTVVK